MTMASAAVGSPSRMREAAAGQAGGLSSTSAGGAGGIGEAPSSRRRGQQHGHSQSLSHSTPSSSLSSPASPSAIDRFIKSLLPQSAFPSSIVGAAGATDEASGSQATTKTTTARLITNNSNTTLSRSRASSVSSSSSSLVQPVSPATAANGTPGKSKSRAPRSSIGAGKAAHAQRHHHQGSLSIDPTYSQPKSIPPSDMITRTRSKTAGTNVRAPSPASFYAGGIGGFLLHL